VDVDLVVAGAWGVVSYQLLAPASASIRIAMLRFDEGFVWIGAAKEGGGDGAGRRFYHYG